MVTRDDVPNEPGWTLVGGSCEGDLVPELPVELWSLKWENTRKRIPFKDPTHGRQLYLDVYEIASTQGPVTFAVREVSNVVYLFAVPRVL